MTTDGAEAAATAVENDMVSGPIDGPRRNPGRNRGALISRLRRDLDAELARVLETIGAWEEDRIGGAGYLVLIIAIAFNVWAISVTETATSSSGPSRASTSSVFFTGSYLSLIHI